MGLTSIHYRCPRADITTSEYPMSWPPLRFGVRQRTESGVWQVMDHAASSENIHIDEADSAQSLIRFEAARIALRRVFEFGHDVLGNGQSAVSTTPSPRTI
jgi:hypothetical protein